jgi:sec-independent protein translocase protein TatA
MIFNMGPQELVVIGVVAVLLFGKNLPDVARKLGKSYTEFRKSLSEMQAQMRLDDDVTTSSSTKYYSDDYDSYEPPTAPKFEPPTSEPTAETEEV